MAQPAYDPRLDEDYLSPEEAAEIKAMFKPAIVRGSFPERPKRFVPPELNPWTPGEVAWAALGATFLGVAAGYIWRKHRENKARERTHVGGSVGDDADDVTEIGVLGDGLDELGVE